MLENKVHISLYIEYISIFETQAVEVATAV